jgi:hypothetical protein
MSSGENVEKNNLQPITALKPMLEEKQAKLVAGSFHSLAELLLQVVNRLEKQNKEAHADKNDQ